MGFIQWLRRLLGLERKPPEPATEKAYPRPSPLYRPQPIPPKPVTERRLPKSFTNRPGVKKAQVNLRKSGYDPDAKIEDEKPRRRGHG